jgi:hypothetical protein
LEVLIKIASMTFMMFFVRLKIVDEPMSIAVKTGTMKRGNWAMEMTVHLVVCAVIVPIIYAMVFWKFFLVRPLLKIILP